MYLNAMFQYLGAHNKIYIKILLFIFGISFNNVLCSVFYFILFFKSDHEGMAFMIFCLWPSSEAH